MNEEFLRILDELREMRREGQDTRDKVTSLVTQAEQLNKQVPDHENRLRVLERWRYGIPAAGVTAVVAAITAFTASKGA